jgi:exopolysaccharide biosynthesis polyprenyl glycosylphosphotransferase
VTTRDDTTRHEITAAGTPGPPRWQRTYGRFLLAADAVAIVAAVALAQWARFGEVFLQDPFQRSTSHIPVSLALAGAWMLALWVNQSRSPAILGAGAEEYRRVWTGTLAVFGAVAIASMLFKLDIARGYLAVALPAGIALLTWFRWLVRRTLGRARTDLGRCMTRVVVVGNAASVGEFASSLAREPSAGYTVVGACIPGSPAGTELQIPGAGSIPTFGDESKIVGALTATAGNAVAVANSDRLDSRRIRDLSWQLEKLNIDLLVAPSVVDVAGPRLHMRPVAGLPLIHVDKPQYQGAKRFEKRLFDVAFAAAVLLFGSPLLLTTALAVKLTSRGPVFYRQERIGLGGQPFRMLKFRTMVDGADTMVEQLRVLNEADSGVLFKIRDDPRVTPVGRFLRRYSLDELPQFINVLKRDMSVVGPRPPLAREVDAYDEQARRRLLVRPGITGLWQISGRSDLSWEDTVRLDLFYVENWSMVADLLIAVKTARAVFCHQGAY